MNSFYGKILVIALIFLGESLSIFAEMMAARTNFLAAQAFWQTFFKMFLVIAPAGGFLIAGYMLGFLSFRNIWIVSVVSITSILIVEPMLAFLFFHQLPTKGALIGLIFGVFGFVSALWL